MNARARITGGRQAGVSLLEVLVAVLLISFGATVLVMGARTSRTGQERSKVYGEAVSAAKEVLEELNLKTLPEISRLAGTPMPHSQGPGTEVFATARGVRSTDVGNFPSLDTASLRHVTLRIRFRNKAGNRVEKVFTTILYKP